MNKHRYKSRKKIKMFKNKNSKIGIILNILIIGVVFCFFYFFRMNFQKIHLKTSKKQIENIIYELEKKYQANLDVSTNNQITTGKIQRDFDNVVFNVVEPGLLANTEIRYNKDNINIKYKNIELKTENCCFSNNWPISTIIGIENMVYHNDFDNWDIKDDILSIEGTYNDETFVFKADLRKNRVIFVGQENKNIFANYK